MTLAPETTARRLAAPLALEDTLGLEQAIDAWHARDFVAMIGHCVGAEATNVRLAPLPDGPGWTCSLRQALLFIGLHTSTGELWIEAPVARLAKRQRVPVLRAALELCDEPRASSRICLRGELLVVRFVSSIGRMTPTALRLVLREVVAACERFREQLSGFDVRAPLRDDHLAELGWEVLGQPRYLDPLGSPKTTSGAQPLPDEFLETPSRRYVYDPPAPDDPDALPAVLATIPARPPSMHDGPNGGARGPEAMPLPREVSAGPRATIPDIDVDMPRRRSTVRFQSDELAVTPADRLCDLLRTAQVLATALSFGSYAEAMLSLVRATVFRAIFEYGEDVPDAVAHLYREAFTATQPMWEAASARRRIVDMPVAEPALLVMGEIVRQRAMVAPEEPLVLEPLTTVIAVRDLLVQYTGEIDRAPDDLPLRYFLALGALSEVLVRTKLPKTTRERLEEILRLATRDGAKATSLDLVLRTIAKIRGEDGAAGTR